MRTASAFLRSALAIVALFIATTSIQAAAPNKPVEFDARRVDANTTGYFVKLSWMANREGDAPTHFDIYMAQGQTEDESKFDKIGSKEATDIQPGTAIYYYLVENLQPGTYTFFIRAVNDDGESVRSIIRVVVLEDNTAPKIDITSTPPNHGTIGKVYRYIAKLFKNFDGGKATWTLVHGPDGMTISQEGEVVWPEAKAGRYEIKIKVEVEINGVVLVEDQSWVIEITEGDNNPDKCVTVYGSVTNEAANTVVMNGVVTAWRMERVTKDNGVVTEEFRPVVKAEVHQGTYSMMLPAGTYKFRIEGEGFYAEWFEDVHELADAENIVLTCDNPRVEVNFVVAARPAPTMHVVKGRVYDAETNAGIFNALVTFEARKKDGAGYDSRYAVRKVETDHDGNYAIEVPEGMSYVASAVVRGDRGTTNSLYFMEWWQETHDATQATVLEITGNVDGIDFSMDKKPVYDNGFSGKTVEDSSAAGVQGKVTIYKLSGAGANNEPDKTKVVSVETDADGNFVVENLEPGKYIVFGTPGVRPYVPGWYVAGGVAAHEWRDATEITVTETSTFDGVIIRYEKATDGIGRGHIRGWVFDRRGGAVRKDDGVIQAAEGIVGSLVVVTDEAGKVIDFAISENEGAYEMNQLGLGVWKIQADRIGFLPTVENVTLDDQNLDVSLSIGLVKAVTSVEVPTAEVGTVYNLYPNPASSEAVISFPSTQGSAEISLISTTGVVLGTQKLDVVTGQTTTTIATSSIPSGMILVRVANGTHTFALPLQIVR